MGYTVKIFIVCIIIIIIYKWGLIGVLQKPYQT